MTGRVQVPMVHRPHAYLRIGDPPVRRTPACRGRVSRGMSGPLKHAPRKLHTIILGSVCSPAYLDPAVRLSPLLPGSRMAVCVVDKVNMAWPCEGAMHIAPTARNGSSTYTCSGSAFQALCRTRTRVLNHQLAAMATTKKPPVLATPGAVLRGLRPSKPTHVPPTQLHR
jgi:hypothetical protein